MRSVALICSAHLMFFFLGAKQNACSGMELASPPPKSTTKSSSESLCFQERNNLTPKHRYSFFLKAQLANNKLLGLNCSPLGILKATSRLSYK